MRPIVLEISGAFINSDLLSGVNSGDETRIPQEPKKMLREYRIATVALWRDVDIEKPKHSPSQREPARCRYMSCHKRQ